VANSIFLSQVTQVDIMFKRSHKTPTAPSIADLVHMLLVAILCTAALANAQAQTPNASEEDRLKRLGQLADAIQRVKIDQKSSTGDLTSDGRRFSNSSELHMRFLVAAADLTENKKDAICIFPVQVSGFTSEIDSSKKIDNQQTGADMQKAEIRILGLVGQAKPKVKVQLSPLNHGSQFPADQIARDKIHDLVKLFFPEAEIDGIQKFYEKEIQIQNATQEPIKVWIFGRSWVKSNPPNPTLNANNNPNNNSSPDNSSPNNSSIEPSNVTWAWVPGDPLSGKPIELQLAAGQSKKVPLGNQTLSANSILVWAESETGERWTQHKSDPLWTVEPNPKEFGNRAYHAEKIELFTHKIEPQPGPKLLTERLLEMKNDTTEPIEVELRYRTQTDRGFEWKIAQFNVPAKQTLRPKDSSGALIRSSRIEFIGKSDNRQYLKYKANPLWLVEDSGGRRAYKAEKIGVYRYTFQAATQSASVAVDSAPVQIGTKTIATVKRSDKFDILATEKDWVQVAVNVSGAKQTGWIKKSNLNFEKEDASPPPDTSRKSLNVISDDAELKQGTTTLARLRKGESYKILEQEGKWLRIEAVVNGNPIHGWVQDSKVKVTP
jgi:hypothetical protein